MIRNTVSKLPICLADSATARASPPAVRVPSPLLSPLLKVAPVSQKQNPFNLSTHTSCAIGIRYNNKFFLLTKIIFILSKINQIESMLCIGGPKNQNTPYISSEYFWME
jgi:hypothetical protein